MTETYAYPPEVAPALRGKWPARSRAGLAYNHHATPPPFLCLMMKGASVRGTAVGSATAYADLIQAVDTHGIKPPIDRVFPFEQAREAYQAAVSPELFGKIVIQIAG